jgi:hypothetical protein
MTDQFFSALQSAGFSYDVLEGSVIVPTAYVSIVAVLDLVDSFGLEYVLGEDDEVVIAA